MRGGDYAVGLTRIGVSIPVIAYDIDVSARAVCTGMAALNEVQSLVDVRGECDHAAL